MKNIEVSVVIPNRNEAYYLENCILSIINGTPEAVTLEILVVDGNSTDKTEETISELQLLYPFIKKIENHRIFTQFALNEGIKNAKYEWIMIASAHSAFPKNYIETIISKINEFNADGAGGQLSTEVKNKNNKSNSICKVLSHPLGVGNSKFRTGTENAIEVDTVPFGIYKKSLFYEVGFYDERLNRNHDIEWSKRLIRAKKSIYLIPDVSCIYYARENFTELAKNNFKNGKWNILTVAITKTYKSLSIRHFVPLGFVLTILLTAIIGVFYNYFLLLNLAIVLIYLLAIGSVSLKIKTKETKYFYIVFSFITLHFSYGWGSLVGIFSIFKIKS